MPSKREILNELATIRDEARVRVHLLSMEAKERWGELETALQQLERKLDRGADEAAESAVESARSLFRAASDFLISHAGLAAPARFVMTHPVLTCQPGDSVNQAAQVFWDMTCGAAPVVDAAGTLQGMLSDRDICMAAYTQGRRLLDISVESAMSRRVYTASPDDSLQRVLEIMSDAQVRHLPIVDAGRKVVGIVSLVDVANWLRRSPKAGEDGSSAVVNTLAAISGAPAATEHAAAAQ